MRNDFRAHLSMLDDDDLDDVTTAVTRERARRSQPAPEAMSQAQYMRWVEEEIRKTAAARAAEAAREQPDD
jgi:hypothetical protein